MLNEPIFDKMKNKSLWTMSSVTTKMPLDLQWFIAHQNQPDCIKGAKYQDHRSLGTYEELQNAIPLDKLTIATLSPFLNFLAYCITTIPP